METCWGKKGRICLPLEGHVGFEDDGNGEADEDDVGDDIACGHCNELRYSLSAHRARVWNDLPVMVEWLAFGQSRNDDCDEGNG